MIDVVIGLGGAGCLIANRLQSMKMKSSFFTFDAADEQLSNTNVKHIAVPFCKTPEEYEIKFPKIAKHFKNLSGDLLLITAGGGNMSLASLNLLSQLKSKFNITVIYIRPEPEVLTEIARMKERTVFNVFQEYARSGLFKMLYIVSNDEINKALGGLPVFDYHTRINETIASVFYTINSLQNVKSVFNTFHEPPVSARIGTFGSVLLENDEERMFYSLDNVTDSVYYFGYSEATLKSDSNVLQNIKNMIKIKNLDGKKRLSYGVFATSYKSDFVYGLKYTSEIQVDKKSAA